MIDSLTLTSIVTMRYDLFIDSASGWFLILSCELNLDKWRKISDVGIVSCDYDLNMTIFGKIVTYVGLSLYYCDHS